MLRRRGLRFGCGLVVAIACGGIPVGAAAQVARAFDPKELPIVVNGAERPDLVPDRLAARHFVQALANERIHTQQPQWADVIGDRLSLAPADAALIVEAIDDAIGELRAVDNGYARLLGAAAATPQEADSLRLRRQEALDGVSRRLEAELSVLGNGRLRRHLDTFVKPRIVIYGAVPAM